MSASTAAPGELQQGRLRSVVGPVVEAAGYELVELEWTSDQSGAVLRLYIDTVPPGTAGRSVDLADCTRVSHRVGEVLDEDPSLDAYRLEVSSPGLFRPLTKPEHFDRVLGERIRARTHEKLDGRRVFVGTLRSRTDGRLRIDVDGREFEVPFAMLAKANLEPLLD